VNVVVQESVVDDMDGGVVEVLEVLLLDLVLDVVVGVEVVDETALVLDEVEAEEEDIVELEASELVAEEEEVEDVVCVVEDAEFVDFVLEIAAYARLAAAAISTIASIAKTAGATPRLLLTSMLVIYHF
jgi:hypothetical protein